MSRSGPEVREIATLRQPLRARVRLPGSKSLAARALVAAALSEGESEIHGDLGAGDIVVMTGGLRALGVEIDRPATPTRAPGRHGPDSLRVRGLRGGSSFPGDGVTLDCGEAGIATRLLTALAALASGPVTLDGSPRLRQRPIEPLLAALRALGCHARSVRGNGCPPVEVTGEGLDGGECVVTGAESSQYLSALLLAGTRARGEVRVRVEGPLVSRPYADMTIAVARAFGLRVHEESPDLFVVTPGCGTARSFDVEPDASSAGYAFAAAAITGGEVLVEGLPRATRQPDIRFLDLLEEMGCAVEELPPEEIPRADAAAGIASPDGAIRVRGGSLRGIRADLSDFPDTVPALAVVALFAEGETRIEGVAHLRFKESDRLAALAGELTRLGARVGRLPDGLIIRPGRLRGAEVETYGDHRLVMALALAGLRIGGVRVRDPGCVAKSFPGFWSQVIFW